MSRFIANPHFWVLAFVVTWIAVVTVLIATGPTMTPAQMR